MTAAEGAGRDGQDGGEHARRDALEVVVEEVGDVLHDVVVGEPGEGAVPPGLDGLLLDDGIDDVGRLLDQVADLVGDDRDDREHQAGEDRQDADQHDQDGEPARQLVAFEPRDGRVDAEREEQRGADVGDDRAEHGEAAADRDGDEHTQASEEAEPERVLDLHRCDAPSITGTERLAAASASASVSSRARGSRASASSSAAVVGRLLGLLGASTARRARLTGKPCSAATLSACASTPRRFSM